MDSYIRVGLILTTHFHLPILALIIVFQLNGCK